MNNQNFRSVRSSAGKKSKTLPPKKGRSPKQRGIGFLNFDDEKTTTTDEDELVPLKSKLVNPPTKIVGRHAAVDKPPVTYPYEECEDLIQVTEAYMDEVEFTATSKSTPAISTTSIYDGLFTPETNRTTLFINTTDDTMDETEPRGKGRKKSTITTEEPFFTDEDPPLNPDDISELTLDAEISTASSEKENCTISKYKSLPTLAVNKDRIEEMADDTEDECTEKRTTKKSTANTDEDEADAEVVSEDDTEDYKNNDDADVLKGLTTEHFEKLMLPTRRRTTSKAPFAGIASILEDIAQITQSVQTHYVRVNPKPLALNSASNVRITSRAIPKQKSKETEAMHVKNIPHAALKAPTRISTYKPPEELTTLHFNAKFHHTTINQSKQRKHKTLTPIIDNVGLKATGVNNKLTAGSITEAKLRQGKMKLVKGTHDNAQVQTTNKGMTSLYQYRGQMIFRSNLRRS